MMTAVLQSKLLAFKFSLLKDNVWLVYYDLAMYNHTDQHLKTILIYDTKLWLDYFTQ